ncbi:hypothetical protein CRENBAI_012866 [Crenichthys baileyi]|uniref:Uncharacterized protein n=1 Tax=Crenichthys baileyi TaxID=28760 RepID=A0AAV9RDE8_9TELE
MWQTYKFFRKMWAPSFTPMHPPDSSLVLFRLLLRHQAGLCGTTSLILQVFAQHRSLSKGPTAHKQALTGRFYSITTGKLKSSDSSQNTVGYKPATAISVTIGQRFVLFFVNKKP